MGEVVVVENVTLDGVMQAPGGTDEDTRGDFRYGGWARPYADHVAAATMGKGMAADGVMLFGRRTYLDFHGFWAKGKEDVGLRFVNADNPKLTLARLALVGAVRQVLVNGLGILGVSAPAELS